jgi:nucleotide-binding universal stress UspA family protein
MRRHSAPLLLVRGYNAPADLTGDPLLRHVLIPLDGSEAAEQAVEPAVGLGTLTGARHTLLRVLPTETDVPAGHGGVTRRSLGEGRRAEAWSYLSRVAARLGGPACKVHPCVVPDDRPTAGAILHYARGHDVDLIALATREHPGLARLLRGSVTDGVVRRAGVPVLVYRSNSEHGGTHREEESRGSRAVARRKSSRPTFLTARATGKVTEPVTIRNSVSRVGGSKPRIAIPKHVGRVAGG